MEFKVLCYAGQFVDGALLAKGIYHTNVPYLYPKATTVDRLEHRAKSRVIDVPESYFANLKKCSLELYKLEPVKK